MPRSSSAVETSSGLAAVITAVYARAGAVHGGTTSRTSRPNCSPITDSVLIDWSLEPSRITSLPPNTTRPLDGVGAQPFSS